MIITMYTLTDYIEKIYSETGLTTYSKNSIINDLNDYYLQVCGEADWHWLEKKFEITTVAGVNEYDLEISNLAVVNAYYEEVGVRKHPPMRYIANNNTWDDIMNNFAYANSTSNQPYLFTIRDGKMILYPNLTNSNDVIHIRCTVNPIPMETEDYSTGAISVTNNSTTITGTGTEWLNNAREGSSILIKTKWYTVSSITNDTTIILTKPYQGITETGISKYRIGDTPLIPENAQSILWKMYCEDYFTKHPDNNKNQVYEKQVFKMRALLERVSSDKVVSNVFDNNPLKRSYREKYRDIYTVYPN